LVDSYIAADHGRIAKLDRDDAPKPPEKIDGGRPRGWREHSYFPGHCGSGGSAG
jgi:hypothetical protein